MHAHHAKIKSRQRYVAKNIYMAVHVNLATACEILGNQKYLKYCVLCAW